MIYIDEVIGVEVLDSRGNPTVQASVKLSDGSCASAIVPSGASTGSKEALELRDEDERFFGKGVLKATENINNIINDEISGLNPFNQTQIDETLRQIDGSENYSNLGANAVLGVSMATARACANSLRIPLYKYIGGENAIVLPTPMLNIINGGSHANNNVDFQEYMIMPTGFDDFKEALRASVEIYSKLKSLLASMSFSTALGDEGGFAPNLKNNEEPIELILKAIKLAGYKEDEQIKLALDVASTELLNDDNKYVLNSENKTLDAFELVEYYKKLCEKYPIISIEDGLGENDWDGWNILTKELGNKIQLVGDDLFVTNEKILKTGIAKNVANAILIKPNQIGTISQTMQTLRLANTASYKCVMSHRSGESEDAFISDLAVALNTAQIKTGAIARGERTAKYNRLLQIYYENPSTMYTGKSIFEKYKQ